MARACGPQAQGILENASDEATIAYASAALSHVNRINSRASIADRVRPKRAAKKSAAFEAREQLLAEQRAEGLRRTRAARVVQARWRKYRLAKRLAQVLAVQRAMRGRLARRRFQMRLRMLKALTPKGAISSAKWSASGPEASAAEGAEGDGERAEAGDGASAMIAHAAATRLQAASRRLAARKPFALIRIARALAPPPRAAADGTAETAASDEAMAQAHAKTIRHAVLASVAASMHSRRAQLQREQAGMRRQQLLTSAAGVRATVRLSARVGSTAGARGASEPLADAPSAAGSAKARASHEQHVQGQGQGQGLPSGMRALKAAAALEILLSLGPAHWGPDAADGGTALARAADRERRRRRGLRATFAQDGSHDGNGSSRDQAGSATAVLDRVVGDDDSILPEGLLAMVAAPLPPQAAPAAETQSSNTTNGAALGDGGDAGTQLSVAVGKCGLLIDVDESVEAAAEPLIAELLSALEELRPDQQRPVHELRSRVKAIWASAYGGEGASAGMGGAGGKKDDGDRGKGGDERADERASVSTSYLRALRKARLSEPPEQAAGDGPVRARDAGAASGGGRSRIGLRALSNIGSLRARGSGRISHEEHADGDGRAAGVRLSHSASEPPMGTGGAARARR
jgi:hypothetical protein